MTNASHPRVDIETICACGATALAVHGRARAMFLCGCHDCRKITGTGHSALAMFASSDVALTGETTAISRPADSGATVTRLFCPLCGTTLCARTSRAPETVLLPAGLLGGDGWFRPTRMIFGAHPADWDSLPQGLARHATYKSDGES